MPENTDGENGTDGGQGGETLTWESVLGSLTEEQQALHTAHTQGLRSALASERDQRKDLAGQLRKATEGLEEGSALRTQLETATAALETATRKADFMTAAAGQGVRDASLAWLAALELDAFDKKGAPDFGARREAHPALFGKAAAPAGNAGAGTGGETGTGGGLNAFIRKGAGRG